MLRRNSALPAELRPLNEGGGEFLAMVERETAQPSMAPPIVPPPRPPGLTPVLERNIQALHRRQKQEEKNAKVADRIADAVTRFAGSMTFVYAHLAVFSFWVAVNVGWISAIPKWDESFVILGTFASVEAIFLSTFVLISQNRMAAAAETRANLDLQVGLLAEHEVTKLVALVAAISDHLGVKTEADGELAELKQDIAPEAVLDEIAATTSAAPSPVSRAERADPARGPCVGESVNNPEAERCRPRRVCKEHVSARRRERASDLP